MKPEEYSALDGTALAELVQHGEVSALDLADAAVERIEALNPKLNAVVERDYDAARVAAACMDRDLPLAGVPFLAKDVNIEVKGLHLTYSCRWLAGLPPATEDAPLALRWRKAGLTILGRTNTPEFAGEFVTEPTWRGATHNPWDLTRSPGGIERRCCRGGGVGNGADRARHRLRRLDSRAGRRMRFGGTQTEPRHDTRRSASR